MAKMEVDYNLKTSGERFQILCLYLAKTYYGLLSFQKFTWYLPLDVPGAFCVWVKAFNLNFSEVLTKREENPRDTAPLSLFKIYLKIVLKLQTEKNLKLQQVFMCVWTKGSAIWQTFPLI